MDKENLRMEIQNFIMWYASDDVEREEFNLLIDTYLSDYENGIITDKIELQDDKMIDEKIINIYCDFCAMDTEHEKVVNRYFNCLICGKGQMINIV